MASTGRTAVLIGTAVVGGLVLSACRPALPPRDPVKAADFDVAQIATQVGGGSLTGPAFTVTGNLAGSKAPEIVTTTFDFSPPGPGSPRPTPIPGSVTMYSGSGTTYAPTVIVPASAGVIGPNRPTVADVDNDGDNDVIVPAGFFFNKLAPPQVPSFVDDTGSIYIAVNQGGGVFTGSYVIGAPGARVEGAYHGLNFTDFDGDGKKDIVTVREDGGFPSYPFAGPPIAPQTQVEYFPGNGNGTFGAPVKLGDGGGSLPVVFDVDVDGDLDVASAQYFGVKTSAIPPFGISDESFVWWERTGTAADGLAQADFTKRVIARGLGESFQIYAVDNIDGDGRYGAIGINHVNPLVGPPPGAPGASAPAQVVRLTPGADIRQPWNVSVISDGFTIDDARAGQAAPGFMSEGDMDGDGDIDIAFSGDADWSIYWLERKTGGGWLRHDVAVEYEGAAKDYGQGSVAVADLNLDGKNELVWSSFNSKTLHIMSRTPGTGGIVPAVPHQPDALQPYTN